MRLLRKKERKRPTYGETLYGWDAEAKNRESERLALFAYDLSSDGNGRRVKGLCALYPDLLVCYEDGRKIAQYGAKDFDGAYMQADGGCAKLILKSGENRTLAAAGTLKHKKRFGGIAGALDRFFSEGKFVAPDAAGSNVCPKCGRPLPPGSRSCPKCGGRKKQLAWLFSMLRPALPLLTVSLLLFIGFSAVGLIPPVLSETMVDGYLKNANADGTYVGAYLAVVAAMLGVTVAQRLIAAVRSAISVRVGTTTAQRLRASVFDKVQSLSLTDVNRRTAGELMQRVTSDTDVIGGFLTHTLGGVVEQTFTLAAIAVIFLVGGFKGGTNLFLFVFLPAIPAAILYRLFHKKIHRIYHMLWQVSAKASARMHDIFSGIRVVKSYGSEEAEIARYEHYED